MSGRGQYDRQAARARRLAAVAPVVSEMQSNVAAHTSDDHTVVADHTSAVAYTDPPPTYRVVVAHAYRGQWNSLWSWEAGQLVTDPDEVAHLRARGAVLDLVG